MIKNLIKSYSKYKKKNCNVEIKDVEAVKFIAASTASASASILQYK